MSELNGSSLDRTYKELKFVFPIVGDFLGLIWFGSYL